MGFALVADFRRFEGTVDIYGQNHNETWELLGDQWEIVEINDGPSARNAHDMVYHVGTNNVVMMGGVNNVGVLSDAWVYRNGWTRLATSPPARYGHTMAYDSDNDVVILFGGMDGGGKIRHDLWEWNGLSWTKIRQRGHQSYLNDVFHPGGRWFGRMVYDSDQKMVLLFGGHDGIEQRDDLWAWDGNRWTEILTGETVPLPRASHGMVYDSARQNTVLYGGLWDVVGDLGDTWTLQQIE